MRRFQRFDGRSARQGRSERPHGYQDSRMNWSSPRPPPGPPPPPKMPSQRSKRPRHGGHVSSSGSTKRTNKRARVDKKDLPSEKEIQEGIEIIDESIEHVSSRLKSLRSELQNIRDRVLKERIENLKSNKTFSNDRVATERRRLESLPLNQLLRIERREMSERLSKDEPALLNALDANGSPQLMSKRFEFDAPVSSPSRPSAREMLLSPDISLDAIFPPMPKPWKMTINTKMVLNITQANRNVKKNTDEKNKTAVPKTKMMMKDLLEKVTTDVNASFEKNRDRMLNVLKKRRTLWYNKELQFAKTYVEKQKIWRANIKVWEDKRAKKENGAAWTSRSRTVSATSNTLLRGGNSSPRNSSSSTSTATKNEGKKGGKYLTRADVVRSEYEQQKLLDEMTQMEKQKTRYLKTVASIVPYVPCHRERQFASFKEDKNGLHDPMESHKEHKLRKVWSDVERLIYIDKFLQYPKDFHRISAFLANKNTRDCVAYYYATKKSIPYKHLLAEQLQRRRGKMSWFVLQETLKVLKISDISGEDLGARCSNMAYREACAVARGELDLNNESDDDSDTELSGYTSIKDKAKFVSKFLRITDNDHNIDTDELRRQPATFLDHMDKEDEGFEDHEQKEEVPIRRSTSSSSTSSKGSSSSKVGNSSRRRSNEKKLSSLSSSAHSNKWMPNEKQAYVKHLRVVGKDWTFLHKKIPTKTIAQIKNFFQNYKQKLQLDKVVQEAMNGKKKRTKRK